MIEFHVAFLVCVVFVRNGRKLKLVRGAALRMFVAQQSAAHPAPPPPLMQPPSRLASLAAAVVCGETTPLLPRNHRRHRSHRHRRRRHRNRRRRRPCARPASHAFSGALRSGADRLLPVRCAASAVVTFFLKTLNPTLKP